MTLVILSFSSINIVRRYISPFRFPLFSLLPLSDKLSQIEPKRVGLSISEKFKIDESILERFALENQKILIQERLIIGENTNCYLARLTKEIVDDGYKFDQLILIPEWEHELPWSTKKTLVRILLVDQDDNLEKQLLEESDFLFIGRVFTQGL